MFLDRELLGQGCLARQFRIYRWSDVWVSIGKFQDPENIVAPGVRWVRRPTGGMAVLHGHDLTACLVMPFKGRAVRDAYVQMTEPLLEALMKCGVRAVIGLTARRQKTQSSSPNCFAVAGAYDIIDLVTLEKICGCAMKVTREAALLQCSFPILRPGGTTRDFIVGSPQPVEPDPRLIECLPDVLNQELHRWKQKNTECHD